MIGSLVNDKTDERKSKKRFSFSKCSFIDYHELNLSLRAREIMRLLVIINFFHSRYGLNETS